MEPKSIPKIIISHLISLCIFLLIVMLANWFISTDNQTISAIINFLNKNILLIVLMSLIFMLADILHALIFPFNLPAPLFSAIGSMLVITFIFRIFELIDVLLNSDVMTSLNWIKWFVYPLVFIIVLIVGFVSVFFGLFGWKEEKGERKREKKEKIIDITPKKSKSWKDVGNEFRNMLYDLFLSLRKAVKGKKK